MRRPRRRPGAEPIPTPARSSPRASPTRSPASGRRSPAHAALRRSLPPEGRGSLATKVASENPTVAELSPGGRLCSLPRMSRLDVETGPLVRATLALPADGMQRAVERGGPLTPYAVEEIVEDALHAGPGASLDLCVAGSAGEE